MKKTILDTVLMLLKNISNIYQWEKISLIYVLKYDGFLKNFYIFKGTERIASRMKCPWDWSIFRFGSFYDWV